MRGPLRFALALAAIAEAPQGVEPQWPHPLSGDDHIRPLQTAERLARMSGRDEQRRQRKVRMARKRRRGWA